MRTGRATGSPGSPDKAKPLPDGWVAEGTILAEYTGEVIGRAECLRRMRDKNERGSYDVYVDVRARAPPVCVSLSLSPPSLALCRRDVDLQGTTVKDGVALDRQCQEQASLRTKRQSRGRVLRATKRQ